MPHILFISYDGLTDPLGQSQIIPYLSGLTKYGYRFTVISCEKPDRFNQYEQKINNLLFQVAIRWVPLKYHKNPPVISAIYDLGKIKRTAHKLHSEDPFDMVHTRSGTPALAGLWLKKKLGIKFLNDIRDFYSDSRVDSGQWKQNNPVFNFVYQYFKKKEQAELSQSDGIICLTQKSKTIIKSSSVFPRNIPLKVIPCSVDTYLFDPESIKESEKSTYKNKLGIRDEDYIISYLGSIGTWYLTDELMQFFKVILKKIPSARLLFISHDKIEDIQALIKKTAIPEKKVIITKATRTEVPLLLSISKYSVFFIKPCYSKQASSPTKHGEMMSMGIPVITNTGVGDLQEIIEKTESGFLIKEFNQSASEDIVDKMISTTFCREKIRSSALKYYDLNNAIMNYKNVYDTILLQLN